LIRGDIKALFRYEDHPSADKKEDKSDDKDLTTKSNKKEAKKAQ